MGNSLLTKIKDNRIAYGEGIYLLYFAIMVGARAAGLLEGNLPYTITLIIGMLLFGLKVLVTEHTLIEYGVMAVCMFVAGMVYLHSGEKGLIVCFTMMLGMKKVSKKKVIVVGALVAAVMIVCKVVPALLGITSEIYYPQERAGVGLMFRHSLGYAHPNTLHMNVLMLSLMVIYVITFQCRRLMLHGAINRRITFVIVGAASVLILGLNLYVFQYSGSRTGMLACIFFIICNFWLLVLGRTRLVEKIILYLTFPISCFLTIVIPLMFPDSIVNRLNDTVFMGRYFMDRFIWASNKPVLWGQRLIHAYGHGMTYGLDSAQMYLFLQLGLVAFALMALLITGFMFFSIKANDLPELVVMETMLVIGLWEPLLYNLSFKNFSFVFMGDILFRVIEEKVKIKGEDVVLLTENEEKLGMYLSEKFFIKRVVIVLLTSFIAGLLSSFLYYSMVDTPSALYGSREKSENGGSLGMEAIYLTRDEIDGLKAYGDIVIGYTDETTAMYKYDETIALMEYKKRGLSVGVVCGIIVAILAGWLLRSLPSLICFEQKHEK